MTTAIKTAECRKTKKTMTTELVCPCGNRLKVSVQKNGWFLSLEAVAMANHWNLDLHTSSLGETFPALCPKCHDVHHCQCRDC
jgi:hypothetical protein